MRIFQLALLGLFLVQIKCLEDDNDSVVIEAATTLKRSRRHILVWNVRNAWANFAEGSPCISNTNVLGGCRSFKSCYPVSRFSDVRAWENWVFGNYDTCTYINEKGFQAFGVCCTTSHDQTQLDSPDESASSGSLLSVIRDGQYPNWPPPIPTHPPDHTPATHPTKLPDYQTTSSTWWQPTTTTTPKPQTVWWPTTTASTWWPTSSTTPRPVYPGWPPTTHPPVAGDDGAASGSGGGGSYSGACGEKNGSADQERIVGGQNADPNEWPWIVVMFNAGRQFCGGSIIDTEHVLTAAHCIAHFTSWDVAQLTVHLGDHNIRSTTEVQHVTRKVKRLVRHRGFDSQTLYNDVALLTLDQPVQFSRGIRPVCLPSGSSTYQGSIGTVVGWGSLRENGPQPSILQEVTLPIWSNAECSRKYGPAAPGGIIESMICAGVGSKDSCSGDSGGPMVVNEGGRWTQAGIVSWGIGCGKGQYPGVYTRVSSHLAWIRKNTAAN